MGQLRDSEGFALATKPADIAIARYCRTYPYMPEETSNDIDNEGVHRIVFEAHPHKAINRAATLIVDAKGELYVEADGKRIYQADWDHRWVCRCGRDFTDDHEAALHSWKNRDPLYHGWIQEPSK